MDKEYWKYISNKWINHQWQKVIKGKIGIKKFEEKIKNQHSKCKVRNCKWCGVYYFQNQFQETIREMGFIKHGDKYEIICSQCGIGFETVQKRNSHVKVCHGTDKLPISIQYPISNNSIRAIPSGLMMPK